MIQKWHNNLNLLFSPSNNFSWNFTTVTTHIKNNESNKRTWRVEWVEEISIFFQIKYDFYSTSSPLKALEGIWKVSKTIFIGLRLDVGGSLARVRISRESNYICVIVEERNKDSADSSVISSPTPRDESTSFILMFMAIDDYIVPFLIVFRLRLLSRRPAALRAFQPSSESSRTKCAARR